MSMIFNARFDLANYNILSPGVFQFQGAVVDNTGNFGASNALLNDIIYNDGNPLALGPLRYKIISIQGVLGSDLDCVVEWAIPGEDPQEPITGAAGCIGRPDTNGVIPIIDPFMQVCDVGFTNAVRNMESVLLSRVVNGISTPVGVMYKNQYDKDNDLRIDIEALPSKIDSGGF